MRPSSINCSARVRFLSDHLLSDCRGVKRISQYSSSKLSSWPSIQPWQSAVSIASGFEILTIPDDFFASEYYKTYYLKCGSVEDSHYIVDLDAQRKLSLCVYQGRSGARFSEEQTELLRAALPLVRELCRQFESRGGLDLLLAGGDAGAQPAAALNRHIREAFMNFGGDCLTEREREIAHLLLRGHSVKSSARVLDISPETVRMHRKHLYTKLEINSQAELFSLFIDWLTRDGPA